ncbi:CidA/LrgA family protein [Acidaminobacter hydrogenoformans]|uniref:Holin-like protein n=1 Tax=Acidaminobacter hydrogenoformans DSM 2784 TaxID=1120920 RepID=A0A1G5S3C0_9FIRM|nr:CidA/LrgA family protein [Acidaminobacter hydrogenoformans]SCZ80806.1 holin-like protein [Acidaminobacter hydrogenoformans DSM 2784]
MKYVLPFGLIWLMLETGSVLSRLIEPVILIPGSILGMLLLFVLLLTGVVKMEWLSPVTSVFLKHMSFFFIPLGVGLLGAADLIAPIWVEMTLLLIVSNLAVMLGVGWIVQWLAGKEKVRS